MKKNTDNYDLRQPYLSGKPGFDLFHLEENGQYYFHYNDASGEPLLYSEAYTSSDGRDNGARSVIANSADEKQYALKKEKNNFLIALKAKNHKEIARSKIFTEKVSAEKAMKFIQNNLPNEKISPAPAINKPKEKMASIPKTTKTKKPSAKAKKVALPPMSAPKYFFKIDLYPHHEDKKISGKIYSAINDKSLNFKGLNIDAIAGFIKSQLPPEMLKIVSEAHSGSAQGKKGKSRSVADPAQPGKEITSGIQKEPMIVVKSGDIEQLKGKVKGKLVEENLQIEIRRKAGQDATSNLPVNSPMVLQLKAMESVKKRLPKGIKIPIELKLKSLSDNSVKSLGDFIFTVDGPQDIEGQFPFYIPYPGVFRLTAHSKTTIPYQLEGSVLVAGI